MKYLMTIADLKRMHIIQALFDGTYTNQQAAQILTLSKRRIQQLKREYQLQGPDAFIHGNAKRPSPKRLSDELVQTILTLRAQESLCSANFSHFHELLEERYGIRLSYSSLHRIFSRNGVKSPKKRRHKTDLHPTRERRAVAGELLQADATPFEWFGGKEKYALNGFIDDATGTVTGLYLCKNECLLGYLEVLRQTLTNFGIPQSLYPDRYSVFFVNPKKDLDLTIEEQLSGCNQKITQFGKIIEQLGIDMFPANSPQAKGRVERLWSTLQSRLPVELALAEITDLTTANAFLNTYLQKFNEQFSVQPKESFSAYVPVPHTVDLDRLLCVCIPRSLSAGSTITIKNRIFQIEQTQFRSKTKVTILLSEKHGLRALINGAFYPIHYLSQSGQPIATGQKHDQLPDVVKLLINYFLLKDAKAA